MHIKITEDDLNLSQEIHSEFSRKEGSEAIASQFALSHLTSLIKLCKPSHVLELGAGIGTMSKLILDNSDKIKKLYSLEENDFCASQIKHNITDNYGSQFRLFRTEEEIFQKKINWDLIVLDGAHFSDLLVDLIKPGLIIFVEGNRKLWRAKLQEELEGRNMYCSFTNYHQGYRFFHSSKAFNLETNEFDNKFKIFCQLKGCWIGEVVSGKRRS